VTEGGLQALAHGREKAETVSELEPIDDGAWALPPPPPPLDCMGLLLLFPLLDPAWRIVCT
jgi:hypothetical protein